MTTAKNKTRKRAKTRPLAERLEEHASTIRRHAGMPAATWIAVMTRMAAIASDGDEDKSMQAADLLLKYQRLSMDAAQMEMAASRAANMVESANPPTILELSSEISNPEDTKKKLR